jgi:hypothetical protein
MVYRRKESRWSFLVREVCLGSDEAELFGDYGDERLHCFGVPSRVPSTGSLLLLLYPCIVDAFSKAIGN